MAALIVCAFSCMPASAQAVEPLRAAPPVRTRSSLRPLALTPDDGLSVIAAALDAHLRRGRETDCSHLVHNIYDRAGFSYPYADSSDLYRGTDHFRRVKNPQPGDLIVWQGHVGIVVSPARHIFFSSLTRGPGTDKYDAQYWKERGPAKFYRYLKTESSPAVLRPR